VGKESRQGQSESPLGIGDPEEIRYHKVAEALLDDMQRGLQTLFRQAIAAG